MIKLQRHENQPRLQEHLQTVLDILNAKKKGSLLFHDWKMEAMEHYSNWMVTAKVLYDDEEIEIMEWLNCLEEACNPCDERTYDTYYSHGGGDERLAEALGETYTMAY